MPPSTGLVALLFADVERSSAGLAHFGDTFRDAIRRLHDIASATTEKHGGKYINHTGDGFYLAFPSPLSAILCACDLQSTLLSAEWSAAYPPLRLRIGIHTGSVSIHNGQYDGLPVWHTHRVMEAANGTQILLSDATHILVQHELPHYPHIQCYLLGRFHLRDVSEPARLFRVAPIGLSGQSDAPPRVRATGRNYFLDEERPFIGRKKELRTVVDYFRKQNARLVTITGIGGMGKTRLAKQAAAEMAEDFPEGVWLVELDRLRHREEILPALCNALNLDVSAAENTQRLYATIDSRRMLLVLDCFELLKEHVGVIEDLLKATTELRCLVTSRQVLGLPREFTYPLEPMSLSDTRSGDRSSGDSLLLFEEAASHVLPDFTLTAQNRATVQEICELLEGIPLSIIFAAGWLRYLTLDELCGQVRTRRLDILTPETEASLLTRHADVRRVIKDSFVMLPPESQRLLHQLGIFTGGFCLEDCQRICEESSPLAMVRKIARLGDHCFVQKKTQGERTRYFLLDTVREYLENVEKDADLEDELARCRQRHATHYTAIARQIQEHTKQHRWTEGSALLWNEIGNLRAAVRTTIEIDEKMLVIELADALLRTYFEAGLWTDFTTLMQATETAALSLNRFDLLIQLLGLQGALAKRRGETANAQRLWERRLGLCQDLGDAPSSIDALLDLAQLAQEAGHFEPAQRLIKQATHLARECKQPALQAKGLALLAEIAMALTDLPRAARYAEQAKRRLTEVPDLDIHLKIQLTLGRVYREGGDNDRAVLALKEMLRVAVEGNRAFDVSRALLELGPIYERQKAPLWAAKTYLAAERCLTHRPSPRHENAKEELHRFENETNTPEIHAFLQDALSTPWQDLVTELLNNPAVSSNSLPTQTAIANLIGVEN